MESLFSIFQVRGKKSNLIYFSISETAPVRLASLRADRARVHWQGSQKLSENRNIDSEAMKEHLSKSSNRLATRGMFANKLFFV